MLVVYTQATAALFSEKMRERSFLVLFFLMPQCIPLAQNPFAAHTPPLMPIISIISPYRTSAFVVDAPSLMFMHSTAAPLAPLPRLS